MTDDCNEAFNGVVKHKKNVDMIYIKWENCGRGKVYK